MNFPLSLLSFCVLSTTSSQAVVLASYDFTGGSLAASSELFAGSASDISFGTTDIADEPDAGPVPSWSVDADAGQLVQDAAIATPTIGDGTNRFSFDYTVVGLGTGDTLDITSATVDFAGTTNTIRFNFYINDTAVGGNLNPPGSGTYTPNFPGTSGETVTGLQNGDVLTFGFASRDNGGNGITMDNVVLNGTVVPEPSSLGLLGCALLSLACRRHR